MREERAGSCPRRPTKAFRLRGYPQHGAALALCGVLQVLALRSHRRRHTRDQPSLRERTPARFVRELFGRRFSSPGIRLRHRRGRPSWGACGPGSVLAVGFYLLASRFEVPLLAGSLFVSGEFAEGVLSLAPFVRVIRVHVGDGPSGFLSHDLLLLYKRVCLPLRVLLSFLEPLHGVLLYAAWIGGLWLMWKYESGLGLPLRFFSGFLCASLKHLDEHQ